MIVIKLAVYRFTLSKSRPVVTTRISLGVTSKGPDNQRKHWSRHAKRTEDGATTSNGQSDRYATAKASDWTVLPRPMSSANRTRPLRASAKLKEENGISVTYFGAKECETDNEQTERILL